MDKRGDLLLIQVRQLGERRCVHREAAALLHELGELLAEPALEDGDPRAGHASWWAMRWFARTSRSTTLRTNARVRCSCACWPIFSSVSGTNSAMRTSLTACTVAWRGSSPPRM